MPSSSADELARPPQWWLRGASLIGLALFCLWFFRFDLPNGRHTDNSPVSRGEIWAGLADVLLENVFPTPSPQAPPSGWTYLPQRFDILAVAAFILAGAWGLGHLTLRGLSLRDRLDAPTRTMFACGLGLSGLSLFTLLCGLIGLLSRSLFIAALLITIVAEAVIRFRGRSRIPKEKRIAWSQRRWDIVPILCGIVLSPFVLAMLLGAMLPSIDFDVKEYHLEGPKEYFLQGQVTFLPHNVYTSFPFLTEMLSLLGMVLRDDWYRGALVSKTVLMSFAPLTALGLFSAGRRWFSPTVGWLSVLVYLTTPWVYRFSIIAYAEGGLTFYLFATLLAVMWLSVGEETADAHSARNPQPSGDRRSLPIWLTNRQVFLSGLLAGSAVACKYPGVLSVAIPLGGSLLWTVLRSAANAGEQLANDEEAHTSAVIRLRRTAIAAGLFTLGSLVTFGPWMAKNIVETGNPVYPLLYNVFGGTDWNEAAHRKWQAGHPPAIVELSKQPKTLVVNLGTRVVDVIARSDWQSPLLFGAAPFALLWRRQRRMVIGLWIYVGWLFLTWWALTHQIDRFWVPLLPVVALLAGAGLGGITRGADDDGPVSQILAAVTALLVALVALFNLTFITTYLCGYNAYLIDLNVARQETMDISAPSIALLQDRLPPDVRVLFVGEAQVFDADFDYVYNTVFDESLFERWTSAAVPDVPAEQQPLRPADEIRQTFREHRITHVFVNWSEVIRYRETYGYTKFVTPNRFQQLVDEGMLELMPLGPPQHQLFKVTQMSTKPTPP